MATEQQQGSSGSGQDNKDPVYGPLQRQDSNAATTATAAAAPPPPPPAAPADDFQGELHERPGDGGGSPSLAAAEEAAAAADRKGKKVAAISSSSSSSVSSNSPPASSVGSSSASSNSPSASPVVSKVASGRKVRVSWKEQVVAVPKLAQSIDLKNVFDDMLQKAERQEKAIVEEDCPEADEMKKQEEGQVKPQTVWPNKDSLLWSKVKGGMKVLEMIRKLRRHTNRTSTFTIPQVHDKIIDITDMSSHYKLLEMVAGQGRIFSPNALHLHCDYSGFRPEQVLDRQDIHEEHRLLAAVKEVAIRHGDLGWNSSKFSERLKAFQKMIKKIMRWKGHSRWKHESTTNSYRREKLMKLFSRHEATKHIFGFLRLVAAIWICSHQEEYAQRVTGLTDVYTLRHWCVDEVIPPRIDADHVQMTALVTALRVPLRVEDFVQGHRHVLYNGQGDQDPEDDVPRCTYRRRHMVPPDHEAPVVTVLFLNNHYDIIYPHRPNGSLPPDHPGEGGGSQSLAAAAEAAAAADRKGKKVAAISSSSSSSVSSNSPPASSVVSSSASSNSPSASPVVSKVASGRKVRVSWKELVVEEVVAVPKLARPIDLKNVISLLQEAERQGKGQVKPRTVWPNKDSSLSSKVKSGMKVAQGKEVIKLPEDVVWAILLHLPPQAVLRFRAVCRSWRDLIDESSFRNIYSSPSQMPLVFRRGGPTWNLHMLDPRDDTMHQILCIQQNQLVIRGSAAGVLLLSTGNGEVYFLSNPITRLWSSMLSLFSGCIIEGFYYEEKSGDFKVLFSENQAICIQEESQPKQFVLSVSTGCITPTARNHEMGILNSNFIPPAIVCGNLHWEFCPRGVLVFDTIDLSYRWTDAPPLPADTVVDPCCELHGYLTVSCSSKNDQSVQLWVQDYTTGKWDCRLYMKLQQALCDTGLLSFITDDKYLIDDHQDLVLFNCKDMEMVRFKYMEVTRHVFRASLKLQHGVRLAQDQEEGSNAPGGSSSS